MILLFVSSCSAKKNASSVSVVPKGARILGFDTNDSAQDFTFLQSYAAAQSVGVRAGTVHVDWSSDESAGSGSTSGTFTDLSNQLASANAFYSATTPASKVSLTVAPIDTGAYELPSDLAGLPINNSNVIARFNHFMDWVFTQTPNTSFTSIQIGNEIDTLTAASSATYWTEYQTFLSAVVSHIHSVKPGVPVGVTFTLYGLIGQGSNGSVAKSGAIDLASVSDEVGLTYYPFDNSFLMKDPSVVATDTASVFETLPSTPIYFQEVGYSTSSACGGSEAKQVEFVDQIFTMWDLHASQIPFLAFLRMNDLSFTNAQSVATQYGLGSNAAFAAYLQTLGFRSYPSPSAFKPAWSELQTQTSTRGF
jgi:hypothetical protein